MAVVEKRCAVLILESQKLKEKRSFENKYFGGRDIGGLNYIFAIYKFGLETSFKSNSNCKHFYHSYVTGTLLGEMFYITIMYYVSVSHLFLKSGFSNKRGVCRDLIILELKEKHTSLSIISTKFRRTIQYKPEKKSY
jgi:hypothetical protein